MYRLYFGAGQSNAVEGANVVDPANVNYPPAMRRGTHFLSDDYPTVLQVMRIGDANSHPNWQDYGPEALQKKYAVGNPGGPRQTIGHSMSIGRALAQALGANQVVLGRFAVSGTQLQSDWLPAAAPIPGETVNLYTQAMAWLDGQLAALPATFEGMWWTQGAADADSLPVASNYGANLATFFGAIRAHVGIPTLRIVFEQLPTFNPGAFTSTVRAQQAAYAASDPYCRMVNIDDGAQRDVGGGHYSADTFMMLGWRMASAFLNRLTPRALEGEPPG